MTLKKLFLYTLLLAGTASIITLILKTSEKYLTSKGYVPGFFHQPTYFPYADTFYLTNDFYTNEKGWLVADKEANTGEGDQYKYINSEGFPSYEFDDFPKDSSVKKVLILGDSFSWGASASSSFTSFASLLDAREDIRVYNTGIPTTDPAQYHSIAADVIPRIKPDFTIIQWCENDHMFYEREIIPYKSGPVYFSNIGFIDKYKPFEFTNKPYKMFSSAEESYNFILWQHSILRDTLGALGQFCSKTCTGTLLYYLLHKKKLDARTKVHPDFNFPKKAVTEKYLKQIFEICDTYNSQCLIFAIPDPTYLHTNKDSIRKMFPGNFDSLPIYIPKELNISHYPPSPPPDGHINDAGHKLYAHLMAKVIDSLSNK